MYQYLLKSKNLSIFAKDILLNKFSNYCEVTILINVGFSKSLESILVEREFQTSLAAGMSTVRLYQYLGDDSLLLYTFQRCAFRSTSDNKLTFVSQYVEPTVIHDSTIKAEFVINEL